MTVFIAYQSGAKGNFLAEICDLASGANAYPFGQKNIISGNSNWLTLSMTEYLNMHNITQGMYHGIYPQSDPENYTYYIDTVLKGMKILANKFAVTTHYIEQAPVEYILSKGARVVKVVTTDKESASKLLDNFFFKNFIKDKNNKNVSNMARHVITTTITPLKAKFNFDLLDKPLIEWDKDSIRVLYKISALSAAHTQEPNLISHENLLEVNVNSLSSIDTLTEIIEFAGGTINDVVKERIEEYNTAQLEISSFDEYIDQFLNKKI